MSIYFVIFIGTFTIAVLILIKPTIGYLRAKVFKAKISFSNCVFKSFSKTLKKDLIKAIAYAQNHSLNVNTAELEAYFRAGVSPLKCVEAMNYGKSKNMNIEYRQIAVADFAGKDLLASINKTLEIHKVEIRADCIKDSKLRLSTFSFEYMGIFKLDFKGVCFGQLPNNDKLKNEVKEKIRKFIEYSDLEDKTNAAKIVKETILDARFWESKGLNMIDQEFKIIETTGVNKL